MKYAIKQKAIAIGEDFSIYDELGKEAYYVDGHALSIGKKLVVYDSRKREVARIRQRLFALRPTFVIYENGSRSAVVKKTLGLRPRFVIDIPGTRDYTVTGNFVLHEYRFVRDRREVAVVSKQFFATTDTYGVDINGGGIVLILCTAIIIDLVLHN